MSIKINTKQQVLSLLDAYDYFLFDCDGVLWLGDHVFPNVPETLQLLKKLKKELIFVTNNSTKSRQDYVGKFTKLGITGIAKEDIFGSSYATAVYIDKILQLPKDKKVWVLGEGGIEKELQELGYTTVGGTDPNLVKDGVNFNPDDEQLQNLDPDVGAVVVGLCTTINYLKFGTTLQYLLKKDIPFIATNIDSTFPSKGKLLVGAGSIIKTMEFASGRVPDAVCGKPNQGMLNAIKADRPDFAAHTGRGLMIGDRLNTDMKFGRDGGLDTLLVLTGIETEAGVFAEEVQPTYYIDKLSDFIEIE